MKLVFAFVILHILIFVDAGEDFYRDENDKIYSLGAYGERVYESDDGKPNRKVVGAEKFDSQDEFADFGWKLFKAANQEPVNNFVMSSFPPQLLLNLIAEQSTGRTRDEITNVVKSESYKKLGKLVNALKAEESARKLEIGTAFFVSQDLENTLKKGYKKKASQSDVDVYYMNFTNPKTVQDKYNSWLDVATHGILKDIPLTVDPKAKMILSSVLYFKGEWLFAFAETKSGIFNVPGKGPVDVDMMTLNTKKFHYGHLSDGNGEWLSIPYNSTDAMLILLPNKTKNIDVDKLVEITPIADITDIINIIAELYQPRTLVNITLPKFKIDTLLTLNKPLQNLGIKQLFSERSEFNPITDGSPLQISTAIQATSFEVSETGSVGASASKFSVVALSVQVPLKEVAFTVDRPFIAVIVNRLYRIPYFIAKVSDPSIF